MRLIKRSGNTFYGIIAILTSLSLLLYIGIYSFNYLQIRLMPDVMAKITFLEGDDSPAILRYRTGVNSVMKEVPKESFKDFKDGDKVHLYTDPDDPYKVFFPPVFSPTIIFLFFVSVVLLISGIKNLAYNRE
ncbi:MAG: hypothetical protein C0601_09765 [Candidatus Muiribacterium halophilum]|uniref:DUF3592 domain-containing protein n=1 Tax=Muiribacterium halophilum TaxID=2053465 RepID=A0A2N5ZDQ9_MUIH1|nr:MAG: hypothetical protein C0601_09765 [Candidatus Muirbacterium halophilum]